MPNISPIAVVTNSLVTEFKPVQTRGDNTIAVFRDSVAGATVTVTSRRQANNAHRAIVKLERSFPVGDPALKMVETDIVEVNCRLSNYTGATDTLSLIDAVKKLLSSDLFEAVASNREGFW